MFWELEFDLVSKPVEVVLIAYGWGFGVIFEVETEGGAGVVTTAPLLMTVWSLLLCCDQSASSSLSPPLGQIRSNESHLHPALHDLESGTARGRYIAFCIG